MSIKQNGGVFGRNPTFNDVTIEGDLIINGEVFTGLDFQGSWNASTNSPALASSVGTNGEFYIVSIAGTTDLNGITNWGIGDWAIFNGTAWQRVEGGADGNFNDVTVAGTLEVTGEITANGGIALGDSDKATFGAGDDLQIYHDGGTSVIADVGTGFLAIRGDGNVTLQNAAGTENKLVASSDGAVTLYYDNAAKIATTTTGIDVTGNMIADGVGIGTSSPTASLSLSNGTNDSNGIKMQASGWGYYARSGINGTSGGQFIQSANWNANTNAVDSASYGTTAIIHDAPSGSVQFKTATTNTVPAEAMRIDSSGNVLVGKTASDLGVTAGIELNGQYDVGYFTRSGEKALVANRLGSDGDIMSFRKDGATVGSVSVTGSATAYNTSSDYRLKEDDVAITGATERVKALRPINFAWKVDGSRVDGFLAHEAQEVVPESVTGSKDAMQDEEYEVTAAVYEDVITPAVEAVLDEDGAVITEAVEETTESVLVSEAVMGTRSVPDMQGIDQSKLVPLLTAALQEAITKIEELTTRIETLEGQ